VSRQQCDTAVRVARRFLGVCRADAEAEDAVAADVAADLPALLASKRRVSAFLARLQADGRTAGNTVKNHVSHLRRAIRYFTATRDDDELPDYRGTLALLDGTGRGAAKKSSHVDRRHMGADQLAARGQWASLADLRFACQASADAARRIIQACREQPSRSSGTGAGGSGGDTADSVTALVAPVSDAHLRFLVGWLLATCYLNVNAVRNQAFYGMTMAQWRAIVAAVGAQGAGFATTTEFKTAATYGFQALAFDANDVAIIGAYVQHVRPLLCRRQQRRAAASSAAAGSQVLGLESGAAAAVPDTEPLLLDVSGAPLKGAFTRRFQDFFRLLLNKVINPTTVRAIRDTALLGDPTASPDHRDAVLRGEAHALATVRRHYQKHSAKAGASAGKEAARRYAGGRVSFGPATTQPAPSHSAGPAAAQGPVAVKRRRDPPAGAAKELDASPARTPALLLSGTAEAFDDTAGQARIVPTVEADTRHRDPPADAVVEQDPPAMVPALLLSGAAGELDDAAGQARATPTAVQFVSPVAVRRIRDAPADIAMDLDASAGTPALLLPGATGELDDRAGRALTASVPAVAAIKRRRDPPARTNGAVDPDAPVMTAAAPVPAMLPSNSRRLAAGDGRHASQPRSRRTRLVWSAAGVGEVLEAARDPIASFGSSVSWPAVRSLLAARVAAGASVLTPAHLEPSKLREASRRHAAKRARM
jgi:hypothetical protein